MLACGDAFASACEQLTSLTSNPFTNTTTEAGVFSNPRLISLSEFPVFVPTESSLGLESLFDLSVLTLDTRRAWEQALEDARIDDVLLFVFMPVCR